MERRVRLPEGKLAYIWTRKRVKNWNLRVSPDGTVTLSTPTGVTGAEADRYVIGKAAWIDASRRRLAGRKPLCLTDGARFAVAGVPVRLHIETGEAGPARWEDGSLTLRLPAGLSQDEEKEAVREALRQVLRDPAERMLTELLRRSLLWMEAETGRTDGAPSLTLRWMRSRWGSCAPGRNRLTLNAALVLAPPDCAAYVVIHELCHRIHPDHSAAFHRLVARVLARAGLADEASLRRQLRGSDAAAWMR